MASLKADNIAAGEPQHSSATTHDSAADAPISVAVPVRAEAAAEALRNGPVGALLVAAISVALLFISWIAFYFFLFLARGPIG
jgi:hypothetical protein